MEWTPRLRLQLGLALLLTLAAGLRSLHLSRPLVGNFATKNATYAMIARNWATGRATWQLPTTDCLSGGDRGLHLVEVPISAYVAGAGWKHLGGSLDVWGRAVSVAWSVGAAAILFWMARRWHGAAAGFGAAAALALSPVSIVVGQSFMLEASLMFFALATLASFELWLCGSQRRWLLAAAVCFSLLALTKVYMLILALPLVAMWQRSERRRESSGRATRAIALLGAGALALAPPCAWYVMAWRMAGPDHPAAEQVFFSIRTNAQRHDSPARLLASADFYRQLLDDLTGSALGPLAFALAVTALWNPAWRRHIPWLASAAILILALPGKFHTLQYYYLAILPPLCLLAGLGWQAIYERLQPGRLAIAGTLFIATIVSLRHAAGPAFRTPPEDIATPLAGAAVQSLVEVDQPVATLHGSSSDLLYYCDRPGWALNVSDSDLEERLTNCRQQGARWLATVGLKDEERERLVRAGLQSHMSGSGFEIFSMEVERSEPRTARLAR